MTEQDRSAPLMQIGGVMKDGVEAAADAIVKVAQASPIPEVAVAALNAFAQVAETKGITVQNCTLTGNTAGPAMGISTTPEAPGKHRAPGVEVPVWWPRRGMGDRDFSGDGLDGEE